MFKSAQVLASTTLLCCVLALSGCGASQAGQEAEGTSAQPSASASVKPGTIRVASDAATSSVTPGSITVVNSPDAENHGSSSEHSASSSHTETHESKQNSDSRSSGPPTRVPSRTSQTTLQILSRIPRGAQTRLRNRVLTLRVTRRTPLVPRTRRILPLLEFLELFREVL